MEQFVGSVIREGQPTHAMPNFMYRKTNGNSAAVEASKIRQQMKKRARETEEPPQQIISVAVGLINDQASAAMPAVHHVRRDLRRQRQHKGNSLPCPQDTPFDIPNEYQVTTDGKPFMMNASGPGDGN